MATPTAKYNIVAVDKSSTTIGKIKGSMRGLGGAFSGIGGQLSALVGGGGFAALIKNSLDSADRIQKLSIQLGLSTEFLSEMGHVAELSGTNLEAVAKGSRRLQQSLIDAAGGGKETSEAFAALGVNVQDLLKLTPDQQFEAVGAALGSMGAGAARTDAALALMGRSGTEVVGIFAQGQEAFDAMREKSRQLNLSLSKDQVDAAAAANDALADLKAGFTGLGNEMIVSFAEPMLQIANGIRETLIPTIKAALEVFTGFAEGLGGAVAAGVQLAQGNFSGASAIVQEMIGINGGVDRLKKAISEQDELKKETGSSGSTTTEESGTLVFGVEQQKTRDVLIEQTSLLKEIAANRANAGLKAVAG